MHTEINKEQYPTDWAEALKTVLKNKNGFLSGRHPEAIDEIRVRVAKSDNHILIALDDMSGQLNPEKLSELADNLKKQISDIALNERLTKLKERYASLPDGCSALVEHDFEKDNEIVENKHCLYINEPLEFIKAIRECSDKVVVDEPHLPSPEEIAKSFTTIRITDGEFFGEGKLISNKPQNSKKNYKRKKYFFDKD